MVHDSTVRRIGRTVGVVALCCLLLGLWAGCSAQKRYRVLSFLFDGVPDPNAPKPSEDSGTTTIRRGGQEIVVYIHTPYQQEQCEACHAERGVAVFAQVTTPDASVCAKCHPTKRTEYPVMHGPVAAGACLWCHDPHQAENPHLLKMHSPQVCSQCHDRALLGPPLEHQDEKRNCLDCHVGHGGQRHGLLRASATTGPATAPTTQVSFAPEGRP